jgi:predicted RNA polymerase sigma factor
MVEGVAATGQLEEYPYLHAARADLLRRLGRLDEAGAAYARARELTANEAEQGVPRAADRGGPRRLIVAAAPAGVKPECRGG